MSEKMDENILQTAKQIICQIFKVKELQEYQNVCLEKLIEGKDCFICQPTGSGNSLIFQKCKH